MFRLDPKDFHDFLQLAEHSHSEPNPNPTVVEEDFSSDEFRMFIYKIKPCPRMRSHDWTECPYAHPGEKANRRDPRVVHYAPLTCPLYRNGHCRRGAACGYAHGVFEYWLHPVRYRTRPCNAGPFCQRKVCFFAHGPEELRVVKRIVFPLVYKPRLNNAPRNPAVWRIQPSNSEEDSVSSSPPVVQGTGIRIDGGSYFDGVSEYLNSLRNKRITDGGDNQEGQKRSETRELESDFQFDWIGKLLND